LRDSFFHRLDRFVDRLPSSFRSRRRPPITSPESDRARQFLGQRNDLLLRLLSARDVAKRLGVFKFLAQLGKPAPISSLGVIIEHLARIAESGDLDPGLLEIFFTPRQTLRRLAVFVLVMPARNSSD